MLTTSTKSNKNYLAQIFTLTDIEPFPDPKTTNLVIANVNGKRIITGKNCKLNSDYVYFPIECKIDGKFLSFTNSYRHKELNRDQTKVGYFQDNSRVRAIKLRGQFSDGYIVPIAELSAYVSKIYGKALTYKVGQSFDSIENDKFVEKYIIKYNHESMISNKLDGKRKKAKKRAERENMIIPDQFNFHSDTPKLADNIWMITPDTEIVISDKWHGTSAIICKTLRKRKVSKFKRWVAKLFNIPVQNTEYGVTYASRTVIKNQDLNPNVSGGFYKEDVWKKHANILADKIPGGFTLYGEIVGYTDGGGHIQKNYDYGCEKNQSRFVCYRMTSTNNDGFVYEYTYDDMTAFCRERQIEYVPLLFKGRVKELFPFEGLVLQKKFMDGIFYNIECLEGNLKDLEEKFNSDLQPYEELDNDSGENRIIGVEEQKKRISLEIEDICKNINSQKELYSNLAVCHDNKTINEQYFSKENQNRTYQKVLMQFLSDKFLEKKCEFCTNDVWAEGIVVRVNQSNIWKVFKFKSRNFLGYESQQLDKGEIDIETMESISGEDDSTEITTENLGYK